LEPISHYYYSHRLKLHFWDWGNEGKPALILVHGGLDHARNWDWVARALREHFHVYAIDLRGHGNSQWATGALYSIVEHVLDLSALADIIDAFPPLSRGPFPGRDHHPLLRRGLSRSSQKSCID
jgi:pimeloyl-ACP methyl ester carboxylesterase